MPRRKRSPVSLAAVRALAEVPTHTLEPAAAPTPERLMRAGFTVAMQLGSGRVQIIGGGPDLPLGADGIVRLSEAPLDRLANRNRLDDDPDRNHQLYEAGRKVRGHHYLAGLSGFAANDLNGGGGGHPASRTPITETMERNRRALRLAENAVAPRDWSAVVAVVCEEATLEQAGLVAGYSNRHQAIAVALDRLRGGLGALAELWGFSPPQRPATLAAPANDANAERAA